MLIGVVMKRVSHQVNGKEGQKYIRKDLNEKGIRAREQASKCYSFYLHINSHLITVIDMAAFLKGSEIVQRI